LIDRLRNEIIIRHNILLNYSYFKKKDKLKGALKIVWDKSWSIYWW